MESELRDVKEHLHDELIEHGRVDLRRFAVDNDLELATVLIAAEHLCRYGHHNLDLVHLAIRVQGSQVIVHVPDSQRITA